MSFYIAEGRSASSESHKLSKPTAAVGSATSGVIFLSGFSHSFNKENRCLQAQNSFRKKEFTIKPISQEGLNALFEEKILKNTSRGFVTYKGNKPVGHYRTKGAAKRMYIEDWYADKAKKLTERDISR